MALTAKKRLFADAVIAGKSNKDAALAAGYSAKTAAQSGSRLVKDPDVKRYLAKRRGEAKATPGDVPDTPEAAKAKDAAKRAAAAATRAANAAAAAGFNLDSLLTFKDPRDFLLATMNDAETEQKLRVQAASVLMPYVHAKKGEGGKKDARDEAAKAAASKFGGAPPAPRLAATGGRKV